MISSESLFADDVEEVSVFLPCRQVVCMVHTHLRWCGKFYYKHMQHGGYSRLKRYKNYYFLNGKDQPPELQSSTDRHVLYGPQCVID